MSLYKRCIDFLAPLQKSWNYGITLNPKVATIHVILNQDLMIQVRVEEERIIPTLHTDTSTQNVTEAFQFAQDYQRATFLIELLQALNQGED